MQINNTFNFSSDQNCTDLYIYGFGLSGKWLSDNVDKSVTAIIETDKKKEGEKYNNRSYKLNT